MINSLKGWFSLNSCRFIVGTSLLHQPMSEKKGNVFILKNTPIGASSSFFYFFSFGVLLFKIGGVEGREFTSRVGRLHPWGFLMHHWHSLCVEPSFSIDACIFLNLKKNLISFHASWSILNFLNILIHFAYHFSIIILHYVNIYGNKSTNLRR